MKHRHVICILDNDKERCLREERALDEAIAAKRLPVSGISNYGANYLARTGLDEFPAIEVDGLYFLFRNRGRELTCAMLCDFLDMLVRRGVIAVGEENAKEERCSASEQSGPYGSFPQTDSEKSNK